jgi:hypothetical protein
MDCRRREPMPFEEYESKGKKMVKINLLPERLAAAIWGRR